MFVFLYILLFIVQFISGYKLPTLLKPGDSNFKYIDLTFPSKFPFEISTSTISQYYIDTQTIKPKYLNFLFSTTWDDISKSCMKTLASQELATDMFHTLVTELSNSIVIANGAITRNRQVKMKKQQKQQRHHERLLRWMIDHDIRYKNTPSLIVVDLDAKEKENVNIVHTPKSFFPEDLKTEKLRENTGNLKIGADRNENIDKMMHRKFNGKNNNNIFPILSKWDKFCEYFKSIGNEEEMMKHFSEGLSYSVDQTTHDHLYQFFKSWINLSKTNYQHILDSYPKPVIYRYISLRKRK